MKGLKKFFFLLILCVILFAKFVYFGGGSAVKYVGNRTVDAGEYLENLESQMKDYIQNRINRLQKAKKSLLSSETEK